MSEDDPNNLNGGQRSTEASPGVSEIQSQEMGRRVTGEVASPDAHAIERTTVLIGGSSQPINVDITSRLLSQAPDLQICGWMQSPGAVIHHLESGSHCDVLICTHDFWSEVCASVPSEELASFRKYCAVVATGPAQPEALWAAVRENANAFVPFSASYDDLLRAIRVAANGYVTYPTFLFHDRAFRSDAVRWQSFKQAIGDRLTRRQWDVVVRIATGMSDKEIARELGLSPRTIQSIVGETFSRLGFHSRVELITRVWREQEPSQLGQR